MNESKIITPITTAPPPEPQLAAKPPEPVRLDTTNTTTLPTQLPSAIPGPVASTSQPQEAINIPLSETKIAEKSELSVIDKVQLHLNFSWNKIIAVVLALQGLYGLYKSISFILIDYPFMENQLAKHLISQEDVNAFASEAIIIVISTVLSMVFAVRFSVMKSKTLKILHKILTITLFVANVAVLKYLNQIGSAQIINQITLKIIDFLR